MSKNISTPPAALPTITLIIATLLWSSSFIGLKIAFTSFSPFVVIFGRMIVATCCLIPFVIVKRSYFSLGRDHHCHPAAAGDAFCCGFPQ